MHLKEGLMFRLLLFIILIGIIVLIFGQFREKRRKKEIEHMSVDDLVTAIIRKEISILEVPPNQREKVESILREVQTELDQI